VPSSGRREPIGYLIATNSRAVPVFWFELSCISVTPTRLLCEPPLGAQEPVLNVLAACVFGLQRFIELMDQSGIIFTAEEARESKACLDAHLKSYYWLAAHFYSKRELLFKLRCKTHYHFHMGEDIVRTRVNPSIFHNFSEESFLGKIKSVAIRCHGRSCTRRVLQRYLLCLAVCLNEFEKTAARWE